MSSSSAVTGTDSGGLSKWDVVRAEWLRTKTSQGTAKRTEVRGKMVDVEDVIESVFSQQSDGILSQPLPLGQMVDILMDFWEADGFFE